MVFCAALAFTIYGHSTNIFAPRPPYNAHELKHWQEPIQQNLPGTHGRKYSHGQLRYMASFEISARVLGKKYYDDGRMGEVAPLDLSLGWKFMSEPEIYKKLKTHNYERWFFWEGELTIPEKDAIYSFANIHIIPSNTEVWRQLAALKVGNLVTLKGYLVNYEERKSFSTIHSTFDIKTSMTRTDTGKGSCEVLYVESVETY